MNAPALQAIHRHLIARAVAPAGPTAAQPLQLPEPVEITETFFDSTFLKANIHCPVGWVLSRDAARTLMKATKLIREAGLKQRKRALRRMKTLEKTIARHAQSHRDLLAAHHAGPN